MGKRTASTEETARAIVPMMEEVAALLSARTLASVNGQVQPGEIIAIYAKVGVQGQAIICGPQRTHRFPPKRLPSGHRFYYAVLIRDDGAEALPVEVAC